MIKRKKYSQELKNRLVLELISKKSSGAAISQREGIAYATLKKWADEFKTGSSTSSSDETSRLRQENDELKQAVADLTLKVRILKKLQTHVSQMRKNGNM